MEEIVRVDPNGGDPAAGPAAVDALAADGAVVVSGAIAPEILGRLADRMATDLGRLLRRPDRAENFAAGHLQQDPPPDLDLLWRDVLMHPFVVRVCRAALRQPVRLSGYTNNTNLPGSRTQAVHVDEGQLWPGLATAHPAARLTVNIPLHTTDAARGAIELWLGTHTDTGICQSSATAEEGTARALEYLRAARRAGVAQERNRRVGLTVPAPAVAARRLQRPPVRATTEAGSLIIRDPRLWHRGMPNTTDGARFMLALTYDPVWRQCAAPMEFPTAARPLLASDELEVCARFTDEPIDHLARHRPPTSSPLRRASADRRQEEE